MARCVLLWLRAPGGPCHSVSPFYMQGAFGVVCSARDETNGETVAIKKISNAFETVVDSRRALREIRLLR